MRSRADSLIRRLLSAFAFGVFSSAPAEDLSLVEALRSALTENRVLQVQELGEALTAQRLAVERTVFDPVVESSASWTRTSYQTRTLSQLRDSEDFSVGAGIGKPNPYGGKTALDLAVTRTTSRLFPFPSGVDEIASTVSLSYTQPLLRGRGRGIAELEIRRALTALEYQEKGGEALESIVLQDVLENYLAYYLSWENLRIREDILTNTREILDVIREKYEMRAVSVIDLRKIETVVLEQEKDILARREATRIEANNLEFSIFTRVEPGRYEAIEPAIDFARLLEMIPVPEMDVIYRLARDWDRELIRLRDAQASLEHDLTRAMDDRKADLSLTTSVSAKGFASDTYYHSLTGVSQDDYVVAVELALSLPVGNRAARFRIAEIDTALRRNRVRIANRQNEVRKALAEHVLRLERTRDELELNEDLVRLTGENLAAEVDRLRGGRSTLLDTLVFQSDHFNAKLGVVRSQVNYLVHLGRLYSAGNRMRAFLAE